MPRAIALDFSEKISKFLNGSRRIISGNYLLAVAALVYQKVY